MNTELMIKAQTLLYSHTDKLEALVVALESVCLESNTKVPETPEHPLINYTVSKKDIGSLVKLWDTREACALTSLLTFVDIYKHDLRFGNKDAWWDKAKPYTDTFKLHFKPWVAAEDGSMPSDVKSGDYVAWLNVQGEITVTCSPEYYKWGVNGELTIIGYCKLSFVNPILER